MSIPTQALMAPRDDAGTMNFQNTQHEPVVGSGRLRLATLAPLLAGLVWGVTVIAVVAVFAERPEANLGVLGTGLGVFLLGALGLAVIAVPTAVGLVAHERTTQKVAATAGALLTAVGGAFWLWMSAHEGLLHDAPDLELVVRLAAVPLFIPVLVTFWALRDPR